MSGAPAPAPPDTGHVVVAIAAYTMERWNLLQDAVASLRGEDIIVVVDYNDTLLTRAQTLPVHAVPNRGGKGLSGARNTAVAEARKRHADIIVFFDDDAVAEPGMVSELTGPFTNPDVAFTTGVVHPAWQTGKPSWFPDTFAWVVGCSWVSAESEGVVRNPLGACMAARATVFDIAQFDENLGRTAHTPAGAEETELGIRHHQITGNVTWKTTRAHATQVVPGERATWRYFQARCLAEGESKYRMRTRTQEALTNERRHLLTITRHMALAVRNGNFPQAAAAGAGTALTALGYMRGQLRTWMPHAGRYWRKDEAEAQ